MGIRARHAVKLSLLIASIAVLSVSGCCRERYAYDCTPRSPWQSPSINTFRSLLLVNREELRVVLVDGCQVEPTFVAENGMREYHLSPGFHSVTMVFRYELDIVTSVAGQPLTLEHEFQPGGVYVAVYREHVGEVPELEIGVASVASAVIDSPPLYWSLTFLDVDNPAYMEPEVEQARAYNAWVIGVSASL